MARRGCRLRLGKASPKWCYFYLAEGWEGAMRMPGAGVRGAFQEERGTHIRAPQAALPAKFQELQEASGAGGSEQRGQQPCRGRILMGGQRVQTMLCFVGHYTSVWASAQSAVPLEGLARGTLI